MRLLILLGLAARLSHGCSCGSSPTGNPPCQAVWQYQAVFTGVVLAVDNPGIPVHQAGMPPRRFDDYPRQKISFQVTRALTGIPLDTKEMLIETGLGGGDCGYEFRRGVEYIVYAHGQARGVLATGICSPTRPLSVAADDLKYFDQLAGAAPSGGEIRVTALDVQKTFGSGQKPSLFGISGAQITVAGNGIQKTGKTDSNGRVVFSKIPAGEYEVGVSLAGYALQNELRPVKLHNKGCAEVAAPLQVDRVTSGRITTNDDVPAPEVLVEAVRAGSLHENEIPQAVELTETDSFGKYQLRGLTAGDYYVGVSISRPPRPASPYTRWFYPGTEDLASATVVHVGEGPGSQTFDLKLPPRQDARKIQGIVLWPDGNAASNAQIVLEDPRWPRDVFGIAAAADSNGGFTVLALDGTRYRIRAIADRSAGTFTSEPVAVEPGTTPVNVILVLSRKRIP